MPSFILQGTSQLPYPREQWSLAISTLSLCSLRPTQKPAILGYFSSTIPSMRENLGFIISLGDLGQSSGMTEGWRRNPDLCRMSLPHPSNPGKGINLCTTPIRGIVDARFLFHFYLFTWNLFVFSFTWNLYFNPQVISLLLPNTTGNNGFSWRMWSQTLWL